MALEHGQTWEDLQMFTQRSRRARWVELSITRRVKSSGSEDWSPSAGAISMTTSSSRLPVGGGGEWRLFHTAAKGTSFDYRSTYHTAYAAVIKTIPANSAQTNKHDWAGAASGPPPRIAAHFRLIAHSSCEIQAYFTLPFSLPLDSM